MQNAYSGILLPNLVDTLRRALSGFALGMLLGILIGVGTGLKKIVNDFMDYILFILLSIPAVIWGILGLIWFGLSEMVALFFVAAVSFPYFVFNVREGVRALDYDLIKMAKSYKVSFAKTFRDIILPFLYPYLLGTVRYGIGLTWKLTVIGEMLGMQSGVGYMLMLNFGRNRVDQVLAWTTSITIIILLIDNVFLKYVEKRAFRWRAKVML
jgi:NitT/TauT family transport system permease protein